SYNQAIDTLAQAKAELTAARSDLKRKRELFTGGVFARSDMEDAQERYDKAVSAWRDADRSLHDAKQGVTLAQQNANIDQANVATFRHNVEVARGAVTLAQANLERDRSIYSQPDLAGSALSPHLTPVHLNPDGTYSEQAAANATAFLVRAPFSGSITNVAMTRGMAVTPGTVLATVVDTRRVYVDASAFEADLGSIHLGDGMDATSSAFPADKFAGHVQVIGKLVDPTSRTVTVRCLVENPQDRLKPGMYVTTNLYPAQPRRGIVVPENSVLVHGDKRFVFVESGANQFDKREVKTGITENGMTEIVSGLKAGDSVVTQGNLLLEGQE
ncbi:MAG: efflux RND transporter periplasmic adaptor subunit, partial [Candidatus Xenobia bacterium]